MATATNRLNGVQAPERPAKQRRELLLWEELSDAQQVTVYGQHWQDASEDGFRRNALWELVGKVWVRYPLHPSDAARFRAMR